MKSRLPCFDELLKSAQLPSDEAVLGHCQLPFRIDTALLRTSTVGDNAALMPSDVQNDHTWYPFKRGSARKVATPEESNDSDTRGHTLCQWEGCSHTLLCPEDQAAHEAGYHDFQPSTSSVLRASEYDERPRLRKVSENNSLPGEKRHCDYGSDIHSPGGPSSTKTRTDRSTKAERSLQGTSSRRPTLKPNDLDVDRGAKHMIEEGKVAHKRAKQIRGNENSTLIVDLERCLPPECLDGCQPRNQRPGYTKNGILKAVLGYHKHQAAPRDVAAMVKQSMRKRPKRPSTHIKLVAFFRFPTILHANGGFHQVGEAGCSVLYRGLIAFGDQ